MKTFKGYLKEAQKIHNTKEFILDNYEIPALVLSTTALERVFGELAKIKGWHITDVDGLKGVIKIQGKKSSISVLTGIDSGSRNPFVGIETEGGIAVELDGTELLSSDRDAWTTRLEAGRRAILIEKKLFPSLFKDMKLMQKEIFKKYHNIMIKLPDIEYEDSVYSVWAPNKKFPKGDDREMAFNEFGYVLPQKEKGQIVKDWIDNCENILKKNKIAQQELRKYGMEKGKGQGLKYNESVVNQISIKNVYVSEKWIGGPRRKKRMSDILERLWKNFKIITPAKLTPLINKK